MKILAQLGKGTQCTGSQHSYILCIGIRKEKNLRALFSNSIEKRLLMWDSIRQPPAFKAVALPIEPPRQPSLYIESF